MVGRYTREAETARLAILAVSFLTLCLIPTPGRAAGDWSLSEQGEELQIAYRHGDRYPQVAVLHRSSSYFRLISATDAGWGTSVVLLPSFWSSARCGDEGLCQGAPVSAAWEEVGPDLMLALQGEIGGLTVDLTVRLEPPEWGRRARAHVAARTSGDVPPLDAGRPGETFKPLLLSSMHMSSQLWDTRAAIAGCTPAAIPGEGWVYPAPVRATRLGLEGGTSSWKANAATVQVVLDEPLPITGWVTLFPVADPNEDNVALWAASDVVLEDWSYQIIATPPGDLGCDFLPLIRPGGM
jgi:hypothetical protein